MQLSDVFLELGREGFAELIRGISIGKLKTYKLYATIKTRTHLQKLSAETLQKATGRLWDRLGQKDDPFARDLSQAVLVSHLDMIVAVLNFLGVPHEDGFFAKDLDAKPYLTEGWADRTLENFRGVYPEPLLRFYTGHLSWELHVDR
ncbi:MAG: hypothetical protein HYR60_32570 [Acidobacteria bacterium]|nr:hypothetical protein [Acidobacteriota bacterium]MBI3470488.1 hypothetical protein [Candidatus Solibacter usitatus]